jgi:hypothetical protein
MPARDAWPASSFWAVHEVLGLFQLHRKARQPLVVGLPDHRSGRGRPSFDRLGTNGSSRALRTLPRVELRPFLPRLDGAGLSRSFSGILTAHGR